MATLTKGRWCRTATLATSAALASLSLIGFAASAGATTTAQTGYLRLCVNSSYNGNTSMTVSGPGVSMIKTVSTSPSATAGCTLRFKVPVGSFTVTQSAEPNFTMSKIKVTPVLASQSLSVATSTAKVSVTNGGATRIDFTDSAAQSGPPGGGDPGMGYIEVCKYAADNFVTGTVNVAINDGATTFHQTLPIGQCTAPIQVKAGNVSVTETAPAPFYLRSVTTSPSNALVSVSGSTAVVKVVQSGDSGTETRVNLYNATNTGFFKVCKVLTANSGDLTAAGSNSFTFDPSYQLAGSSSWVALPKVTVSVLSTGTAYCVADPYALPLGTLIRITEEVPNSVQLVGVSVQPASQDAGTTSDTAYLRIGPNPGSTATATFTDQALGTIEICKLIDDSNWAGGARVGNPNSPYNGTPFQFSVNGGSAITVLAGNCSGPLTVPAGTATVNELPTPHFSFVSYTAVGPDGNSRIASGSSSTSNPVKVNVPFGGVGNETLVTAVNRVQTGQIKVCKINNGPSVGVYAFKFATTWTSQGITYTQNNSLRPLSAGAAGEVCSGLSAPIPVVQPNGAPTVFTTTEGASPYIHDQFGNPTVEPTSIVYGGNGQVIQIRAWQQGDTIVQDGTYHGTATLGQGINVFTFTNSLVLDP